MILTSSIKILDFVLWLLFFKLYPTVQKPPHVLCHGFSRVSATYQNGTYANLECAIPGLTPTYPNEHVETLKKRPWEALHRLLGKHGDPVMVDLFTRCAIFLPMEGPKGTLYQLSGNTIIHPVRPHEANSSGTPLTDMTVLGPKSDDSRAEHVKARQVGGAKTERTDLRRNASEIRFVRHRMLYARPAFNAKGQVALGLRHIRMSFVQITSNLY